MLSNATACQTVLRGVPIFEDLDEEALAALAAVAGERRFGKGAVIFFENDPGDALYVVLSGAVKIHRVGEDGREKTLTILDAGGTFGELALLDGKARSAVAEALEPVSLLVIHREDFQRLLGRRPALALAIIRELGDRLRRTNEQLMDLLFLDVRGRVARVLINLADAHGVDTPGGRRIPLTLTHQELANLVGTSRESVTRTLTDLQDRHLLAFEGRQLVLPDIDGLGRLAE